MALGIGEVTQGFSRTGAQEYKNALNAKAIVETCEKLGKTGPIVTALQAGWQGKAQENFVTNLEKAQQRVQAALQEIKGTLDSEFAQIESVWAAQDNEMVKLD